MKYKTRIWQISLTISILRLETQRSTLLLKSPQTVPTIMRFELKEQETGLYFASQVLCL